MNEDNGGSKFNGQQLINSRRRLSGQWKAHRTKPKAEITVRSCGGEAQFEALHRQWLKGTKDRHFANNWPLYSKLGSFLNNLEESGREQEFQQILRSYYDTSGNDVSLESVFRNCHEMDVTLTKHYKSSLPPARFEMVWWEGIKCCMPLHALSGHRLCLTTHEGNSAAIGRLAQNMRNGKAVPLKLSKKLKKSADEKKRERQNAKTQKKADDKKAKDEARAVVKVKKQKDKEYSAKRTSEDAAAGGKRKKRKTTKHKAAADEEEESAVEAEGPEGPTNVAAKRASEDAAAGGKKKKRRTTKQKASEEEESAGEAEVPTNVAEGEASVENTPNEPEEPEVQPEDNAEGEEELVGDGIVTQDLKDMQYLDDANQVVDLSTIRLAARGLDANTARNNLLRDVTAKGDVRVPVGCRVEARGRQTRQ